MQIFNRPADPASEITMLDEKNQPLEDPTAIPPTPVEVAVPPAAPTPTSDFERTSRAPAAPIPAFMEPNKETVVSTTTNRIAPKAMQDYKTARTAEETALKLYGEKEIAAQDADTQLKQLQGEELGRIQDGFNTQILERRKELDGDIQAIKSSPIDSGRVWRNASTGDKVLAGIALLLSSAGQAMGAQGPNAGLQYIQKTIDQDIDAQKFDLLAKKDLIQEKRSMMSQLVADRGYTVEQAAEAMKIGRYGAASEQLKTAAERARNAGNEALAKKLESSSASIATKSAEKMAELSQIRENIETRNVKQAQEKDYFSALPDERTRRDLENSLAAVKSSDRLYKFIKDNPSASKGMGAFATNLAKIKDTFGQMDPADAATRARFEQAVANAGRAALGAGVLTEQDMIFAARLAPSFGNNLEANLALAKGLGDNARAEANDFFNTREAVGVRTPPELRALITSREASAVPGAKPYP